MKRRGLIYLAVLEIGLLALRPARAAEADLTFRDGDTWSAVGDSITHSGSYHAWIYLYYLTRFPERSLAVTNVGIAGDTAAGGVRRLKWDILPTKPTVATVMFGMNDVGRGLYSASAVAPDIVEKRRAALAVYQENMRTLVAALQQSGARVILLTPTPFDQTAELEPAKLTGVDDALGQCGEFLQTLARETHATVVDFHEPMARLNRDLQRSDPKFTLTGADRIHPGAPGHFVMAYLFLKAQHAPAEVARLTIDATRAVVVQSGNGRASEVRRSGDRGLAFTWSARALPFPIDPDFAPARAWVPFVADLNQEVLQVTGLGLGRYDLRIDNESIATFSADEMAHGVNLAELRQTPQYRQALEVLRLVKEYRLHVQETARNIALVEHQCAPAEDQPYTLASIQPHYEKRMEQLRSTQPPTSNLLRIYNLYPTVKSRAVEDSREAARLAVEARRAAQPKPHAFELQWIGDGPVRD